MLTKSAIREHTLSGPQTALPGYSHYTASKGGVAGFIKTAAVIPESWLADKCRGKSLALVNRTEAIDEPALSRSALQVN